MISQDCFVIISYCRCRLSIINSPRGEGGSGSLSLFPSTTIIGIIASEWAEWLPALTFVHITPLRVWILNSTWDIVCYVGFFLKSFPSTVFVNVFF